MSLNVKDQRKNVNIYYGYFKNKKRTNVNFKRYNYLNFYFAEFYKTCK